MGKFQEVVSDWAKNSHKEDTVSLEFRMSVYEFQNYHQMFGHTVHVQALFWLSGLWARVFFHRAIDSDIDLESELRCFLPECIT